MTIRASLFSVKVIIRFLPYHSITRTLTVALEMHIKSPFSVPIIGLPSIQILRFTKYVTTTLFTLN